ncbi:MAG TPA: efflux transporter outer membrane subunit [Alphaproteobacteria bacterium]|jgi:NodT family efflux transporter outer membrane factor (OMF) lipoprotein|nr:efflux transporter outer membrane subunit [Alphaproteobacteria bacterium]
MVTSLLLTASACSVGPDYQKPDAPTATQFKELAGWKPATPADAVDRGSWWTIYKDPRLDDLEKQIDISNQTLKESEAAYRQSRAVVDQARASFFPVLAGNASAERSYVGPGASRAGAAATSGGATTAGFNRGGTAVNSFSTSLQGSWDLDVWGRIRRTVEGDVATAQASAADLASARLSAQATLATDYVQLRYQEQLKVLLETTAVDFKRSLEITQNQYNAGVAAKADVLSAQTQYLDAQAQAINAGVLRATLEHAIAVAVGKPPGDFAIGPGKLPDAVPVVPVGLASALLERRPDIAGAERRMAAANAQIGVAIAAYFPDITLTGSYGSQATQAAALFASPTSVWSVGGSVAETLLDFGSRSAQVEQARAAYDEAVATYRQTVLSGFQQVEDELSTLRILQDQAKVELEVVKSAQEAARLTLNQYKAGTVPYSSVITAQATALSDEQTALSITQQRLTASITLIQSIGGGWDETKLPGTDQVEDDTSFLHMIPITTDHPTSSDEPAKPADVK